MVVRQGRVWYKLSTTILCYISSKYSINRYMLQSIMEERALVDFYLPSNLISQQQHHH